MKRQARRMMEGLLQPALGRAVEPLVQPLAQVHQLRHGRPVVPFHLVDELLERRDRKLSLSHKAPVLGEEPKSRGAIGLRENLEGVLLHDLTYWREGEVVILATRKKEIAPRASIRLRFHPPLIVVISPLSVVAFRAHGANPRPPTLRRSCTNHGADCDPPARR